MSELDTCVRCNQCGNEQRVSFADSLRHGWLKCCGSEMTVTTSTTTIEAAMDEILAPVSRVRFQLSNLFDSIEIPAVSENLFIPIQPPQIHEIEEVDYPFGELQSNRHE